MSSPGANSSLERLRTPVQYLKGVGPQRAEKLAKLNIFTALDLLFFFPRDYQDVRDVVPIAQLVEDEPASVIGIVEEVTLRNTGPGRSILGVLIRSDDQYLRAVWFNQPFLRRRFNEGSRVLLSGKPTMNGLRWEMAHPIADVLEEAQEEIGGKILPVYPLTEGIRQGAMRRLVHHAVEDYRKEIEEVLPQSFLDEHGLMPVHDAILQIHAPDDHESKAAAQRRFIYQELLVLQLALAVRRYQLTASRHSLPIPIDGRVDERIRRLIPFELTEAQNQAVAEVAKDMALDVPMNRMLQGDVGSGKTIVALYAMLAAVAAGSQAALMAPTEVLARQHARTLGKLLAKAQVKVGLLTGTLTEKQRRELLAEVASGEVQLLVGTQAMIAGEIEFKQLGLVVIDEQHKFGVRQRGLLRGAGLDPHYLVMTATPIPRTIAMSLFGDLDVSSIREAPPGRQPVHTYIGTEEEREKWWEFFRKKLREGRQGYVVAPLVDESSSADSASAEQLLETLSNGELEEFRLGLLHGRMSAEEKEETMRRFHDAEIQVLVSTSVIEVGVDVPNAVVMTIEGGERFGLAQLHQLRGRISRGSHAGFLCIFADPKSDQSRERLEALAKSTDGFELAELDFRLRGPGDLFGFKQHGMPPLRIADLQRDAELLEKARADARSIIASDPALADAKWEKLRRMVYIRYGKSLEIGDLA
ncbi:ATP-dependent DNA helicase RecG [Blastopirellula sp. JC732]|uniref:ATP-dependent DNA helicase RecG n=1 Tax=Blastopirellula sediminis TaxID=2894196 RepID=A0A9X1MSA4_9BACT|nr:ATP-dependent DNA helicase RecG [Blastopirellula sediminis]MCC9604840.1 ATP-dependent DNA helicase RecG [Blastopirellula sediminis]MCC9631861.1 ATP-dependent DNA helicase RecG [Blastopirellula sediminis]